MTEYSADELQNFQPNLNYVSTQCDRIELVDRNFSRKLSNDHVLKLLQLLSVFRKKIFCILTDF